MFVLPAIRFHRISNSSFQAKLSDLEALRRILMHEVCYTTCVNVCRSLFEKHKLVFKYSSPT